MYNAALIDEAVNKNFNPTYRKRQLIMTRNKNPRARVIQVSDAVGKALDAAGRSADECLREFFKIEPEGLKTVEGVEFPEGTAFLSWYKDRAHWGVVRGSSIEIKGERFFSVSSAAGKITGRPTNGWDFWQCKFPGKSEFVKISTLRIEH